jgi:hypothetical protein
VKAKTIKGTRKTMRKNNRNLVKRVKYDLIAGRGFRCPDLASIPYSFSLICQYTRYSETGQEKPSFLQLTHIPQIPHIASA